MAGSPRINGFDCRLKFEAAGGDEGEVISIRKDVGSLCFLGVQKGVEVKVEKNWGEECTLGYPFFCDNRLIVDLA